MKPIMTSIKTDRLDPFFYRALSHDLPDLLGNGLVPAILDVISQRFFLAAGRYKRYSQTVVNDLARNIAVPAKDR